LWLVLGDQQHGFIGEFSLPISFDKPTRVRSANGVKARLDSKKRRRWENPVFRGLQKHFLRAPRANQLYFLRKIAKNHIW
jgi:hypothetical protein